MIANHKDIIAGVLGVLVGAGVVVGYIYALSFIFKYSLDADVLKIRMLGVTVRKVRVSDIQKIQLINCRDTVPFSRSFQPRFLLAQRWGGYKTREMALEMRSGIFKTLIISPNDPDAFVRLLNAGRENIVSG
jgi:hypothetical protein